MESTITLCPVVGEIVADKDDEVSPTGIPRNAISMTKASRIVPFILLVPCLLLSAACDSSDSPDEPDEDDDQPSVATKLTIASAYGTQEVYGDATFVYYEDVLSITSIFENGEVTAVLTVRDDARSRFNLRDYDIAQSLSDGVAAVQVTSSRDGILESVTLTGGTAVVEIKDDFLITGSFEGVGTSLYTGVSYSIEASFRATAL